MSESIAKKLRVGIIDKLKEYDCYIDNELPDYIMVMIANKKSSDQMKDDLSLFIGNSVGEFVDWLHDCLEQIKAGKNPFQQRENASSKKSNLNREIEQIVNNVSSTKEEGEEKDKKLVGTRKPITFNAKEFEEPKRESSNNNNQPQSLISFTKTKQQRSQHKRIVYNLDDQAKDSPSKKSRITYNLDLRSTLSSSRYLDHHHASKQNNIHQNKDKSSLNDSSSTSNYNQNKQTNEQMIVDQAPISIPINHHQTDTAVVRQLSSRSMPRSSSIFGKAIAEANKSSSLDSIQLRKKSPSKSGLIHRLGLGASSSSSSKDVVNNEDNEIKKENRFLVNTKAISDHLSKPSSLERKQQQRQRPIEAVKQVLDQNQIENLKKDDLRLRLSSKRKNDDEDQQSIKRQVLNNQNKNNDSDEELRVLKDNIKPKAVVKKKIASEIKKIDSAADDSDENVQVIIKRELLEKIKTMEQTKAAAATTTATAQKLQVKHSIIKNESQPSIKKERCYYWPVCNNQDKCQYHHPKAMCLQFPMCKFGQACLNIHPNCRFDMNCTKRDCPYTHVARKLINNSNHHQSSKAKLPSTIQRITPVVKKT